MDLKDFLAVKTAPVSAEPDSPEPTTPEADFGVNKLSSRDGEAESELTTPGGSVISDTTPNGIVVEFQAKPKRLYRVNGVEVPSVTTVLKVLKKDMNWWAQTTTLQGVLELFDRGVLSTAFDWDVDRERLVVNDGWADDAAITAALTAHQLTVNHVRDNASVRGLAVHDALEKWALTGETPSPDEYAEEARGHVAAIVNWVNDCDGAAKPVRTEVMVGSVEYGFAGRCDLVFELLEERKFVKRANPSRPTYFVLSPGLYMSDLKSKNSQPREAYTTDMKQMAGYEIASVEGGYEPTDAQFVLYAMPDGTYEMARSHAVAKDFIAVLDVWKADEEMKKRKKAA